MVLTPGIRRSPESAAPPGRGPCRAFPGGIALSQGQGSYRATYLIVG